MTIIILILSLILNVYTISYYIWYKTHKNKTMEKQEEVILTFVRGRDKRIVAKTDAGKVCLLDIKYCRENNFFVKENEDWRCSVREEKENCIIVQPIERTATATENLGIFNEKMEALKAKFGNKEGRANG